METKVITLAVCDSVSQGWRWARGREGSGVAAGALARRRGFLFTLVALFGARTLGSSGDVGLAVLPPTGARPGSFTQVSAVFVLKGDAFLGRDVIENRAKNRDQNRL